MSRRSSASRSPAPNPVLRELLAAAPPPRTQAQEQRLNFGGPSRKVSASLPGELVAAFRASCERAGVSQREALEGLVRSYVLRHVPRKG